MSASAGNVDSNLKGGPSNDIDKQTGPSSGSNVESPGSTLPGATKPAPDGNNQANQGSNNQGGSSGPNNNNPQQQGSTGSS